MPDCFMKRCSLCAAANEDAATECRSCGGEIRPPRDAGSVLADLLRGGEIVLGAGAFGVIAYLLAFQPGMLSLPDVEGASAPAVEEFVPPPPLVLSLLDSRTLDLPAGEHFDTTFAVSDPRHCVFSGSVEGLAGGNRAVEVYLLDESGFEQWHEEIRPLALFESGRTSFAALDVPLPGPGRYSLLLSNRFSLFTDKVVHVDGARVVCQ